MDKKWHEQDGVIYFEVISDGTTGEKWVKRLLEQGIKITKYDKVLLKNLSPTNGTVYQIAVLKSDGKLVTREVRQEALAFKFFTPHPEVACLIREKFSNQDLGDMGFNWITVMHNPIKDFKGRLKLLNIDSFDNESYLSSFMGNLSGSWSDRGGFAFKVSSETML